VNNLRKTLKKNQIIYWGWRTAKNGWTNVKILFKKIALLKYNDYPGLNGKISHNDSLFANDITHYISVGNSAIENIEKALRASSKSFDALKSVLDFPSGHGRVLRVLATKVSPAKITACDIDEDGINFCEKEFHCKKILSDKNISKIQFPEHYELIWVGSLFTHFDKDAFSDLLTLSFSSLEPGGVLVFTTHGRHSVETFHRYWEKHPGSMPLSSEQLQKELASSGGFYYAPYHNAEGYGVSVSLQPYVVNLIEKLFKGKAKVLFFNERGWDDHQDVFAIQKESEL